ncbi:hypothetical protein NQ318_010203 [Aromia moschata]|uniref:Uncharacterized protein n=1 Tax=Aromia moschata TaxID=1265417 RepID=A0AAV8Y451_9CUCU|nr:hypothetical protein NQ318_010203 [Aromia moschata]
MEQRVNLKFLVKLGKTFIEAYPAHKFLNGLNGLKTDVWRLKTIRAPDGPQRQKRTKKLVQPELCSYYNCVATVRLHCEVIIEGVYEGSRGEYMER